MFKRILLIVCFIAPLFTYAFGRYQEPDWDNIKEPTTPEEIARAKEIKEKIDRVANYFALSLLLALGFGGWLYLYRAGKFDKSTMDKWHYSFLRYPDHMNFTINATAQMAMEWERPTNRWVLSYVTMCYWCAMESLLIKRKVKSPALQEAFVSLLQKLEYQSGFWQIQPEHIQHSMKESVDISDPRFTAIKNQFNEIEVLLDKTDYPELKEAVLKLKAKEGN
ncbi:hypothetical protein CBQ28_09270 [Pseudoalteromonas sp. GCY]|uniref:hypothetical protein n=1 Tax=Pseudoalteromonas sp. GCY TaxID=2003316 RepID=UPI000BFED328|nr:hypothetical protein [Pseudoalteromonas sp. GCY]PHI37544.1 hypothetical protein CBQ28_09270 [Pseudoalteromonas sp. GCY]QQQ64749.1 hypothetical protein JJQ94_03820 [Pseudoalteromonas sp. GCY]